MQNSYLKCLLGLTWLVQKIPLRIQYAISDFLFIFVYFVFRYRRNVVSRSLKESFPEKNKLERKKIEVLFYHHLCDQFVETFYFTHISEKEIRKRMVFKNNEIVQHYIDQGRPVIVSLGHHNNWEWLCSFGLHQDSKYYVVYKKLHSPTFDAFYRRARSRFKAIPLEKKKSVRQLIADANAGVPVISGFLNDQRPYDYDMQFSTTFLNQETPVLLGTEKIARKTNAAIIGLEMRKKKRGYYEAEFSLICDDVKDRPKFEPTKMHTQFLEKVVRNAPEFYLWSHDRRKHIRKQEQENNK